MKLAVKVLKIKRSRFLTITPFYVSLLSRQEPFEKLTRAKFEIDSELTTKTNDQRQFQPAFTFSKLAMETG